MYAGCKLLASAHVEMSPREILIVVQCGHCLMQS